MAIFTGNWLDPDGVPFDATAKQVDAYAASGTASIIPKPIWKSKRLWLAREKFGIAAHTYADKLTQDNRDNWQTSGRERIWSVRQGGLKTMTGQAHYMRSQLPPYQWNGLQPLVGDPGYQGRSHLMIQQVFYYQPSGYFHLKGYNDSPIPITETGFLKVFQIKPHWQGMAKARYHTRLLFHDNYVQTSIFYPEWCVLAHQEPFPTTACLLIVYGDGISIIHYTTAATFAPDPDPFPDPESTDDWEEEAGPPWNDWPEEF